MKWSAAIIATLAITSLTFAQGVEQSKPRPIGDVLGGAEKPVVLDSPPTESTAIWEGGAPSRFAGNRNFDNFIGFISNPIQNIDPRAMTAIWPMFATSSFSPGRLALPDGDFQLYGAGLYVALSERLSIGLNQGGYAAAHLHHEPGPFVDHFQRLRDRAEFSGDREGWLNFGFFVQYTLIEDVPNQFLATAGLRVITPSGATDLFQGHPPWRLAPYLTVGKEFGCYHFLATVGYQFPAGSAPADTNFFNVNMHFDRKIGWLYPLVELNWTYHTSGVELDLPTRDTDFINFGSFSSSGNILILAVGANAVLRPGLEFGVAYTTPIASQHGFDANTLLVKLLIRF